METKFCIYWINLIHMTHSRHSFTELEFTLRLIFVCALLTTLLCSCVSKIQHSVIISRSTGRYKNLISLHYILSCDYGDSVHAAQLFVSVPAQLHQINIKLSGCLWRTKDLWILLVHLILLCHQKQTRAPLTLEITPSQNRIRSWRRFNQKWNHSVVMKVHHCGSENDVDVSQH